VDEQFADHVHLQLVFLHVPDLAVRQRFHAGTRFGLGFNHTAVCGINFILSS
jgi:hypothetical protein